MARRLMKVGLVMTLAMSFGGCGEVLIVSDAKFVGHDSLFTQEDWVQSQTEEAIVALGQPAGWWVDVPELQWPRDQEKIIGGAETEICSSGPIDQRPGRLILDISNDSFGDPALAAQKLWEHWEAAGWELSYVIDPAEQPSGRIDFRADRNDGAMLGFSGSPLYVVVSINSSCSDDDSVMKRY